MTDMTQRLLDSMDGVALILDADLTVLGIGRSDCTQFLEDNGATQGAPTAESARTVIGRPITAFMVGESLRQTYAALFRSVLEGRRKAIRLDYRCDSPDLRRNMRLAVTLLRAGGDERRLLYQSILLSAEGRAALPLFGAEIAAEEGPGILTLCAICARVAWPVGAGSGARDWIDPADYYRRGGSENVSVSHGFCESCHARLTDED